MLNFHELHLEAQFFDALDADLEFVAFLGVNSSQFVDVVAGHGAKDLPFFALFEGRSRFFGGPAEHLSRLQSARGSDNDSLSAGMFPLADGIANHISRIAP